MCWLWSAVGRECLWLVVEWRVRCWCWVGCFRSEKHNINCHVINSIERFNVILPEKPLSNDFLWMCDLSVTHHNRKYSICEHVSANSTFCVLDHVPLRGITLTMKGSFPSSMLTFMFARIFLIPSPRSVLPKLFPLRDPKVKLNVGLRAKKQTSLYWIVKMQNCFKD